MTDDARKINALLKELFGEAIREFTTGLAQNQEDRQALMEQIFADAALCRRDGDAVTAERDAVVAHLASLRDGWSTRFGPCAELSAQRAARKALHFAMVDIREGVHREQPIPAHAPSLVEALGGVLDKALKDDRVTGRAAAYVMEARLLSRAIMARQRGTEPEEDE